MISGATFTCCKINSLQQRMVPDLNYLPKYIHKKGLKIRDTPDAWDSTSGCETEYSIKGTRFYAADIADTVHICPWNSDMYGVDMTKPGLRNIIIRFFELLASWVSTM